MASNRKQSRLMKYNKFSSLLISLLLVLSAIIPIDVKAEEEAAGDEEYHLVFCSDLHYDPDPSLSEEENHIRRLDEAFAGLPDDVAFLSLIGDMVGERGGDAPEYDPAYIYERTSNLFNDKLTADKFSIIWADHDAGVIDEDETYVRMKDGYRSGVIHEGKDENGKTIFIIYAIGFYHMTKGGETSQAAAEEFKNWICTITDKTIPIIVLCHVPIQTNRGDNNGASYWNEALNYAATGVEGIGSTDTDYDIKRNVIYLCAHNHTNDSHEYVFPAGTTMSVQIDTTIEGLLEEEVLQEQPEENVEENTPEQENQPAEEMVQAPPPPPRRRAQGVMSDIYYTSMVPGYLRSSGNAMLMTITKDSISCTKYKDGYEVHDWHEVTSWNEDNYTPEGVSELSDPTITIQRYNYLVAKGDNSVWDEEDHQSLKFTFRRTIRDESSYADFREIKVDGEIIAQDHYSAIQGSVNIELYESYLKTLSEGTHTIQAIYNDGESEIASFTVKKAPEKEADKEQAPEKEADREEAPAPYYVIPLTGIGN